MNETTEESSVECPSVQCVGNGITEKATRIMKSGMFYRELVDDATTSGDDSLKFKFDEETGKVYVVCPPIEINRTINKAFDEALANRSFKKFVVPLQVSNDPESAAFVDALDRLQELVVSVKKSDDEELSLPPLDPEIEERRKK